MTVRVINRLIIVAILLSVVTFLLWDYIYEFFKIDIYYLGSALFIFVISLIIFLTYSRLFISFLLLCLSINNLLDELFFDPKKIQINEFFVLLSTPLVWYLIIRLCHKKY